MQHVNSLSFRDTADIRNRVATVVLDSNITGDWLVTLNGTDNNGQHVIGRFVTVDNLDNIAPIQVDINGIENTISPYTRTTYNVGNFCSQLGFSLIDGIASVYIAEQSLRIPDEQNQLASGNAFNMGIYLNRDGSTAMLAPLDFGAFRGVNIADPVAQTDVVNKRYADTSIGIRTTSNGSVGNKIVDDSVASQNTINACLLDPTLAIDMLVVNCLKITIPQVINRAVDTAINDFNIIGVGKEAGFYVDSDIDLFTSTLPFVGIPNSERINFININFIGDGNPARLCYALSKHFLRVSFTNCTWNLNFKLLNSPILAQDFTIDKCHGRNWLGDFFTANTVVALNVLANKFEFGGRTFVTIATNNANYEKNVCQSSTSFIVNSGGFNLNVQNNYFEQNASPDVVLTDVGGGGQLLGANVINNNNTLTGANAANVNFYPYIWGDVQGGFCEANYCNGNLHDFTNTTVENVRVGCERPAAGKKISNRAAAFPGGVTNHSTEPNIVATGANQGTSYVLICRNNEITGGAINTGVMLKPAIVGAEQYVLNISGNNKTVYPQVGETINGVGAPGIALGNNTEKTYRCYVTGQWTYI